MASEDVPDKKLKIRPRGLDSEKEKIPEKTEEKTTEEEADGKAEDEKPDSKKHKWDNRLRQSGKKFTSKYVSKPLEGTSVAGEGSGDPVTSKSDEAPPADRQPAPLPAPPETSEPGSLTPSPDAPAAEEKNLKRSEKKPDFQLATLIPLARRLLRKRIAVSSALAAILAGAIFFSVVAWKLGISAGQSRVFREQTKEAASVSREFLAEIDAALADLRAGNAEKASKKLSELEASKSQVASLTYLLALAAMQNGDIELAEKKAGESIAKRERISDSLALQAVIQTQKGQDPSLKKFGDTRLRTELLLRQAMLADAANPFPMVELATLLRYQKRNDEALALLRAARSRLNPVDSHTVIEVTMALITLADTPDSGLPEIDASERDLSSALSSAYVAMRRGDFDKAVAILRTARRQTSPDLFDYLINDPTIRRFASEPKLREFFQ